VKSLSHECHQGLVLKRFGKKLEGPTAYAVPCQILVDIARHEDHSQVFPHAERADGQLVAVDVGELIGDRGHLKARRGQNELCEQEVDGPFVLGADLEGLRTSVGSEDRKARLLKDCPAQLRDGRFVIDHQDGRGNGWWDDVLLS